MKIFTLILFSFICFSVNAQQWEWGRNAQGSDNDKTNAVCTDASGNVFVTGSFESPTITFGSITLTNSIWGGGDNMFIAKYDANGNVLWAKHVGNWDNNAVGTSVSIDGNGNVFVTGHFASSTITFDSITLNNGGWADMFIAKYDPNGNVLWAKNGIGASLDAGVSVSTDIAGDALVTGFFESSTLTFGTHVLTNSTYYSHGYNLFLVKYDANGNVLWAKSAVGTGGGTPRSVNVDPAGNAFVTGEFNTPSMTFDSITLTGGSSFIAKYDVNGNVVWAKSTVGAHSTCASADPNGNVFVAGWFGTATIAFGSVVLNNSSTGYNVFTVKYDANGNALWAKSADGGLYVQGWSVSADLYGNAFVTGYFQSPPIAFDSVTLTPPPANCSYSSSPYCDPMFIVKYDANGNVLCASSLASGNGSSVSADRFGNAYIGGWFGVNPFIVNTDTLPFTSTGLQNVFVGKFYSGNNDVALNVPVNTPQANTVFPNPSSGIFTVDFKNTTVATQICVYDVLGNCLWNKNCRNEENTKIDLSSQPKGIYFLEIVSDNKKSVNKIVLQ